jgi:spermidine/putrescine transport system permease protein
MKINVAWRSYFTQQLSFLLFMPAVIWPIIFLYIPLSNMLLLSFMDHGCPMSLLGKYAQLLDWTHMRIIVRSLALGLSAAAACLICAYPAAYFIAIRAKKWKHLLLFLLMIPLWTNFLIQVYGWQFIIARHGLMNVLLQKLCIINEPLALSHTLYTVFIVMVYCYIPFMFMPLYSALASFDTKLLEASADLGASSLKTFLRVTLPLSMSGIRTGILLTFVLGFGEFAIPALIGGGKYMTVGMLISYYFLIVGDNALGAAFTCLSGVFLLMTASLLYACLNRWCKKCTGLEL